MNLIVVHLLATIVLVSALYLRGSISLLSFAIAIIIEVLGRFIVRFLNEKSAKK